MLQLVLTLPILMELAQQVSEPLTIFYTVRVLMPASLVTVLLLAKARPAASLILQQQVVP